MAADKTIAIGPELREVWVRRDGGGIECKPWLVFDVHLKCKAQERIALFLEQEGVRVESLSGSQPSASELQKVAPWYRELVSAPPAMPPRLLAIESIALDALPTELASLGWYTLGDSVGGISPQKPATHNAHIAAEALADSKEILFSPGLLCRIPILFRGALHYIFQLADKNLRVKGQAFYKPIGGHLKHTIEFHRLIKSLGLRRKGAMLPQDVGDIAFFVPRHQFEALRHIFLTEIANRDSTLLVPPRIILAEELSEELGPDAASDGIPLLTADEVALDDSQAH